MVSVTFYEKPGCKGNARQKQLLEAAGHVVTAKSLKAEPWTTTQLRAFLDPLPVADWFNRSAPAVKHGEIVPEDLSPDAALALLLANPLLIRRPLMEVGETRMVGFERDAVHQWIGLNEATLPEGNLEACVHGPEGHGRCGSAEDHAQEHGDEPNGRCGAH